MYYLSYNLCDSKPNKILFLEKKKNYSTLLIVYSLFNLYKLITYVKKKKKNTIR